MCNICPEGEDRKLEESSWGVQNGKGLFSGEHQCAVRGQRALFILVLGYSWKRCPDGG